LLAANVNYGTHISIFIMTTFALILATVSLASAFSPIPKKPFTLTTLKMSDVPSSHPQKDGDSWKDYLPPSPEDQLIMTGDIAALFVYSFMDHTMNEWFVEQAGKGDIIDFAKNNQIPVWFDTTLHTTAMSEKHLLTLLGLSDIYYSPLICHAGAAFVILTSCWLASGWVSGAFLFRNTLDCKGDQALLITFKTWMLTCAIMVAFAWGSNVFLFQQQSGLLTKADADYIFDSLTVLITWRFIVNAMLGYGR
jgi:hypothetical protein